MATLNIVPPQLDLTAYGGDDTVLTFTITDQNGDPIDISGTHSATIRPDQNSETSWEIQVVLDTLNNNRAFLTVTSEVAAEVVVDATDEAIRVDDELITAPMFTGVWDWQYEANGVTRTLVFGTITVIGEVTK